MDGDRGGDTLEVMSGTKFLSEKNNVDLELALSAMAATASLPQAVELLNDKHGITTSVARLEVVRRVNAQRYGELCRQWAVKKERQLAGAMIDNSTLATVSRL
jgi:hypothetical protein